jgi:hypothetical protein
LGTASGAPESGHSLRLGLMSAYPLPIQSWQHVLQTRAVGVSQRSALRGRDLGQHHITRAPLDQRHDVAVRRAASGVGSVC